MHNDLVLYIHGRRPTRFEFFFNLTRSVAVSCAGESGSYLGYHCKLLLLVTSVENTKSSFDDVNIFENLKLRLWRWNLPVLMYEICNIAYCLLSRYRTIVAYEDNLSNGSRNKYQIQIYRERFQENKNCYLYHYLKIFSFQLLF